MKWMQDELLESSLTEAVILAAETRCGLPATQLAAPSFAARPAGCTHQQEVHLVYTALSSVHTASASTLHIPARSLSKHTARSAHTSKDPHVCRQQLCDQVQAAKLDRLCLTSIDASALLRLPNLRSLHLQHNSLTSLAPLSCLSALRFLSAAHNSVSDAAGISHLDGLMTLDLSHNCLAALEPAHLPTSLLFLLVRSLCTLLLLCATSPRIMCSVVACSGIGCACISVAVQRPNSHA